VSTDPESAKKTENLTVFFELLGPMLKKALNKMLVKYTPGSLFVATVADDHIWIAF